MFTIHARSEKIPGVLFEFRKLISRDEEEVWDIHLESGVVSFAVIQAVHTATVEGRCV